MRTESPSRISAVGTTMTSPAALRRPMCAISVSSRSRSSSERSVVASSRMRVRAVRSMRGTLARFRSRACPPERRGHAHRGAAAGRTVRPVRRRGQRRPGRWRLTRRRWAGARVAAAVRHVQRRAGSPAARPGPDRGHRRAIPGCGPRRAAVPRRPTGPARGAARCGHRPGHRGSRRGRHTAALHALRLRAEPGVRGDRRGVRQPRAARGRDGRGGPLRGPGRAAPGGRRCRHHRGHRAEQPSAAAPPPAARARVAGLL